MASAEKTAHIPHAAAGALSALALVYVTCHALADEPAKFVGGRVCSGCHAAEAARWQGSHHALAMQKATEATVLGDFADAKSNIRHRHHFLALRRQIPGPYRRTRRRAPRLRDRLHLRRLSAAAISDRDARRAAIRRSASPGTAARRSRAASAGFISIPTRNCRPATGCTGPGAIRPGTTSAPTATPPICRRTTISRRHLCDDVDRRGRVLRGLPRAGSRHVAWAQVAQCRRLAQPTGSPNKMGLTNWLKPTDHGPLGDEPGDRHRPAHRATGVGGSSTPAPHAIRAAR